MHRMSKVGLNGKLRPQFTIDNLPYGVFSTQSLSPRIGVAYQDRIIDLHELSRQEEANLPKSLQAPVLNDFMAEGGDVWRRTRATLQRLLKSGASNLPSVKVEDAKMHLPCKIGNYTDFYASESHATNVGTMFRGAANALNPNWKVLPVGYHGRASSVSVSGTPVRRPMGLVERKSDVKLMPTAELDFELELAAIVGVGNKVGERISVEKAIDHIFGFVLMNDWSARDIQRFEYVPLGPFLGKNFLTSISPWIVPMDALRPFLRTASSPQLPTVADYLNEEAHPDKVVRFAAKLGVNINGHQVCVSDAQNLYWSFSQMVAHHTVGGCNLQSGDLLGSGTISGADPSSFGSLLELNWNKTRPVVVGSSLSTRHYLEDGDSVEISGSISDSAGNVVIDFGVCEGSVRPSE